MIRKLRHKFIAISMLSVAAVLILLVGGMNIATFVSIKRSIDLRMEILSDNGGSLPKPAEFPREREYRRLREIDDYDEDDYDEDDYDEDDFEDERYEFMEPPDAEGSRGEPGFADERRGRGGLNAEAYFDIRFFTVDIKGGGESSITANIDNISSVSEFRARDYALGLYSKEKYEGFIDNYKYQRLDTDTLGGCTYIFMDAERELSSFKNTLYSSIAVSVAGLLLVFILVCIFSKLAVRPMAESYEKQKLFITDASHELKTPLAIIDANTEVLEMESGESEWTQSIHKQVKRLSSLTQKLVFLSRMDEGNTESLNMLDFDLSEAILDVAESYKAVARASEKEFVIAVDKGINFRGDEANIRQMLSLLLDNAMKYSDVSGRIELSLKNTSKGKNIRVYNTAEGLKAGRLDYLFDRFYRGDSSRNSRTGGFGIGLSVVQAIVQAHKGKVSARSVDGKSIEFLVYLP